MEFSGRLTSVPLPDLLQWAYNDRRSGCLVIRTSSRQKRIFFNRGDVVGCYSDDPNEYFGQFLLLQGYLDADQLRDALAYCRSKGKRLGASIVELGMLSTEVVQEALRHHVEDTICDLFLWTHGLFYFENRIPVEEDLLPSPINTLGLAMEGGRWVDEDRRMRRVFVHDNILLARGPKWEEGAETPLEERVLERFDDLISVSELYNRTKGTRFRFREAIFNLTLRDVLAIDSVGEETVGRISKEIRIFDLLMEQAAEEQVVFSSRHLSLPLEVLDRFYPVWIEEADQAVAEEMEMDDLLFYRSMDGSVSLHELLEIEGDVDEQVREHKMELILLQLRRGNVALLPRPLSQLDGLRGRKSGKGGWLERLFG